MKRRRPTISSLPTAGLFILLEQYDKELTQLKQKQLTSEKFLPDICKRMNEVNDTIYYISKVLVDRCSNISINKLAKLFIDTNGIKKSVYEEVFVQKILNGKSMIILDTKVFETVINQLSVENLIKLKGTKTVLNAMTSTLQQGGIEMSEEIASEVLGKIANKIVMGEYSDHDLRIKELIAFDCFLSILIN